MKKFRALALHSFRESVHSKALIFIVFYVLFMIIAFSFLKGIDSGDRVKTLQSVSLLVISLFGTLLAVVLPILSLHEEIETKKVYNVFTKPVSRFTFLAGKAAGILMFVFLFTCILSLISLMFIVYAARNEKGILKSERLIPGESVVLQRDDDSSVPLNKRIYFNDSSEFSRIKWSFSGIRPEDTENGSGRLRLDLFIRGTGALSSAGYSKAYVNAVNPSTGKRFRISNMKQDTGESPYVIITHNQTLEIGFPQEAVSEKGRLDIELFRPGSKYRMRIVPGAVSVMAEPGSYFANYFKTVVLLCVKYVFITAVSLCAGAFFSLGSGVAFTAFLLLVSLMLHFVSENAAPEEEQFYERVYFLFRFFVPDLTVFSKTAALIDGLYISWSFVAGTTLITLCTYTLGYLGAAYFGLRDREF